LILLVVYLSLTPDPIDVGGPEGLDLGHFSAYFTLMAWWAQLVRRGWPRVVLAAALIGMGIGLEFVQGMTDYRTFDPLDMRANAVGVAAAFALALTPLGGALAAAERWLRPGAR
jgi:hypothetical protein